ncbi:hypothetical protein ACTFIU_002007 [Dictyostelium citrinum]
MKIPNRQKFTKNHKRKLKTKESRKTGLVFGNYGIKGNGNRIFKNETNRKNPRQDLEKGDVSEWYVLVKKGSIVVEFIKSRMTAGEMQKIIRYSANKWPIKGENDTD